MGCETRRFSLLRVSWPGRRIRRDARRCIARAQAGPVRAQIRAARVLRAARADRTAPAAWAPNGSAIRIGGEWSERRGRADRPAGYAPAGRLVNAVIRNMR